MNSKKILIVEDDLFAAESLQVRLKTIGFPSSVIVTSGNDAIRVVKEMDIDLILMDINIRGEIDGIDTAQKIRRDFDTPLIFLTASKDEATWSRAKIIEPFAYLFKPFDLKELQIAIEMALYKYNIERQLKDSETRYRNVVEDQTEMIMRMDEDGNIIFCNQSFLEFFSVKNGVKTSHNFFAMLAKENKIHFQKRIKLLSDQKPVSNFEIKLKLVAGTRYLKVTLRRLLQIAHSTVEFQFVASDVTSDSEAQEILIRNEEYYREMFEEGLSSDFISSPEGQLIDCNNQFLALYGFPDKKFALNYDLHKLFPEKQDRVAQMAVIREEGQLINTEVQMMTFDSRKIWVLSNMIGVFDDHGDLVKIRGYEIDITGKKKAETALIESEEQARALFHGNTDPIFITDLDDKCVALNPAFSNLFGYSPQELYGQKFPGHSGIDEGKFDEWKELCMKGLGVSDYETIRSSKKGNYIPVSLTVSPIRDSRGKLRLISFWYRDISERKQIEAARERAHAELETKVRERTSELRAMYDQSPIGMCIFNRDGKVIEVNEAWKDIWQVQGFSYKYNVYKDPFYNDSIIESIKKLFLEPSDLQLQPIFYNENRKGTAGKVNKLWLKHTFYSIQNLDNSVSRVVNMVEDVSEAKRAIEISERYEKQRLITATIMETLEQERKRLSKEIHDGIGQMLTLAKMGIEIYEKENNVKNSKLQEAKTVLYNVGSEVENLINALRPDIFDNYGLIRSVEIMCQELEELTGISLLFSAYGFNGRLENNLELNLYRIIQEAVNNVAKHSKATRASVQLFNRGKTINVMIEDNGEGFDSDFTKKENLNKAGFGLMSMMERAEQFGGKVYIESDLKKGTEISIEIPILKYGEIDDSN
ncbi:MAG: PAS domain S-box protein [Bacteroidetes bacterium]|nr:PAS domain S-box protein [Bacteroidota bacterium]